MWKYRSPQGHLAGFLDQILFLSDDTEGWFPNSLVEGNDGFLCGTSLGGGANTEGVIFKLSKAGKIQVLHGVCNSCGEGAEPAGLILANDGNFYGVTETVLFRITPNGLFTVLHSTSANQPLLGTVQASDGQLCFSSPKSKRVALPRP